MNDIQFLSLPFDIKIPPLLPVQKEHWLSSPKGHFDRIADSSFIDTQLISLLEKRGITVGKVYIKALPPNFDVTIHTDIEDFVNKPGENIIRLNIVQSTEPSFIRTWNPIDQNKANRNSPKTPTWYETRHCRLKEEYVCPKGTSVMLFNPTIPHSAHSGNSWRLVFITDVFVQDTATSVLVRMNKDTAYEKLFDLMN